MRPTEINQWVNDRWTGRQRTNKSPLTHRR